MDLIWQAAHKYVVQNEFPLDRDQRQQYELCLCVHNVISFVFEIQQHFHFILLFFLSFSFFGKRYFVSTSSDFQIIVIIIVMY